MLVHISSVLSIHKYEYTNATYTIATRNILKL